MWHEAGIILDMEFGTSCMRCGMEGGKGMWDVAAGFDVVCGIGWGMSGEVAMEQRALPFYLWSKVAGKSPNAKPLCSPRGTVATATSAFVPFHFCGSPGH